VDNLGAKSKKLIYGLAILVSSIILTVSLYGAFNPIGTSQESNILSPSSVSTDDDAIRIALPIVEEYIEENNRTITNVEAILRNSTQPYWFVEAAFEPVEGRGTHDRTYAYQILVRPDTAEIWYHGTLSTVINFTSFPEVKIAADEAIRIAMPVVEQYAEEYNRTITPIVQARLSDDSGGRWNPDWNPDSRPIWSIGLGFEAVTWEQYQQYQDKEYRAQPWVDGYVVYVWADTGEIHSHLPQGHY